jgi:hypothetical protein
MRSAYVSQLQLRRQPVQADRIDFAIILGYPGAGAFSIATAA